MLDRCWRLCTQLIKDRGDASLTDACLGSGLNKMARHDAVDGVMAAVTDGHGQLHLVTLDLARVEAGLR